ncbi:MAG: hypothetical protein Q4F55_05420, partial [Bacillota bacterium]|nr:hypothetical protein [Bacillota bacterium]
MDNNQKLENLIARSEEYLKENNELIELFRKSLFGLADKTIKRHVRNVETFINAFCAERQCINYAQGLDYVSDFLGYYAVHTYTCCSADSLRQMATSIKKFYKCMMENNKISEADYEKF